MRRRITSNCYIGPFITVRVEIVFQKIRYCTVFWLDPCVPETTNKTDENDSDDFKRKKTEESFSQHQKRTKKVN